MNGDGKTDLAFSDSRDVKLLFSRGNGEFSAPVGYLNGMTNVSGYVPFSRIGAGDFSRDGRADLFVVGNPAGASSRDTFGLAVLVTTIPLPTSLAGVRVKVRDSAGAEFDAPLFFVSSHPINYLVPKDCAPGNALLSVINAEGIVTSEAIEGATIAPGLFAADATGQGVAAAALRVGASGAQTYEPVARFDAASNRFIAVPIDLRAPAEQVFRILFGTGIRCGSPAAVTARVGGMDAPVTYAGPQGGFERLDQVNVLLPGDLIGRGKVEVGLTVEGQTANAVRIGVR